MPSRIYSYGAKLPELTAEAVKQLGLPIVDENSPVDPFYPKRQSPDTQLDLQHRREYQALKHMQDMTYKAHVYQNKRVELELTRRQASNKLLLHYYPELAALENAAAEAWAAVDAARQKIKDYNQQTRTNTQTSVDAKTIKAMVKTAKVASNAFRTKRKLAFELLTEKGDRAMLAAFPDLKPLSNAVKTMHNEKKKKGIAASVLRAQGKEFGVARRDKLVAWAKTHTDQEGLDRFLLVWINYQHTRQFRAAQKATGNQCIYGPINDAARGFGSGPPPKFMRFTHSGRIGVQLVGGISVEELAACTDTQLQMEILDAKKNHARLRIRIASDKNSKRAPVWCCIRFNYHRPLPPNTKIKNCWLLRRRQATHDRWFVQFTVSGTEADFAKKTAPQGTIGVELGSRIIPGVGLRVACWAGKNGTGPLLADINPCFKGILFPANEDGSEGELILPISELDGRRWSKADNLRSTRDKNFNPRACKKDQAELSEQEVLVDNSDAVVPQLLRWRKTCSNVPDWFNEKFDHVHQWRSQARFAAVILFWRHNRFAGDESIFPTLETWRIQDRHLYDWEVCNRGRACRWRDYVYQNFVAAVRERYATVHLKDTNYAALREYKPVEKQRGADEVMRKNQGIASPGRMAELFRSDMSHVLINPTGITAMCHLCGAYSGEVNRGSLLHQCGSCGAVWDQDVNAAYNLMHNKIDPVIAAKALADDSTYQEQKLSTWERSRLREEESILKINLKKETRK